MPTFVISGLSGSGKSHIASEVSKEFGVNRLVTVTTREKRKGEIDGIHYNFVSKEKFEEMIADNLFLEWALVYGNLYGTLKSTYVDAVSKQRMIILVLDVQGARTFKATVPETVTIFIDTDQETALRRIRERGTYPEEIAKRETPAENELREAESFDYRVSNVDQDVSVAVETICEIIYSHCDLVLD